MFGKLLKWLTTTMALQSAFFLPSKKVYVESESCGELGCSTKINNPYEGYNPYSGSFSAQEARVKSLPRAPELDGPCIDHYQALPGLSDILSPSKDPFKAEASLPGRISKLKVESYEVVNENGVMHHRSRIINNNIYCGQTEREMAELLVGTKENEEITRFYRIQISDKNSISALMEELPLAPFMEKLNEGEKGLTFAITDEFYDRTRTCYATRIQKK